MVIEKKQWTHDINHIHVLLYGVTDEKPCVWGKNWLWIGGFAEIKKYDSKSEVKYYLANKIANSVADFELSPGLTRNLDSNNIDTGLARLQSPLTSSNMTFCIP